MKVSDYVTLYTYINRIGLNNYVFGSQQDAPEVLNQILNTSKIIKLTTKMNQAEKISVGKVLHDMVCLLVKRCLYYPPYCLLP